MTDSRTVPVDDDIVDYTPPPGPRFRVYDAVYEGIQDLLPKESLLLAAKLEELEEAKPEEQMEIFREIFRAILTPDSVSEFLAHLEDRDQPIGTRTMTKVVMGLMEHYTERPTKPGSDSSPGSDNPGTGTSSTDTSSDGESTSSDSPSPGS